jgi:hydrogenase maturation protease
VGNILMGDDGAGVRAVELIVRRGLPPGVEAIDAGTDGIGLVDAISGRRTVVAIDALAGQDEPGTIRRLSPEDLEGQDQGEMSLHDFGLIQAWRMAHALACAPERLVIIGIQVGRIELGLELTPEVVRALPRAADMALHEALGSAPR